MRIQDLFEDRASTIAQKQGDTLLQKAKGNGEKYTTPEDIVAVLKHADPSKNSQYLQWLTTQYLRGLFRLEDASRVHDELAKFEHIKNKLDKKDINQYTYYTLSDLIDKEFKVELKADSVVTNNSDVKVLYDGPLGNLSIPLTQEASCELGRGTKWCTAADDNNMFDYYDGKGPLYIWRDKSGDKYQFHFEEYQFMDARDRPISKDKLKYFREEHPVISKLFKKYEADVFKYPGAAIMYAKEVVWPDRWPEAESRFIQDPETAYRYARSILNGRWPEAEAIIATDPEWACNYAIYVMKSRWPEAEHIIATDPCMAYHYAHEVMKSRWPEAEPVIASEELYRRKYNDTFGTSLYRGKNI